MQSRSIRVFAMALLLIGLSKPSFSGNLDSPGDPSSGSVMPTLVDIYNQLATGEISSPVGVFQEPSSGPTSGTGTNLNQIKGLLPNPDNITGAATEHVLKDKKYWGLRTDGSWGLQTGSMPLRSLSDSSTTMNSGYYSATTLNAIENDLVSNNIKSGVTIFGVSGNANIVDTSSGNASSEDLSLGKTAWVDGIEITGSVSCNGTMHGTRWCDNNDGTITDMTTGLTWMKSTPFYAQPVSNHLRNCFEVQNGHPNEIKDGSIGGDWRLPSKDELLDITNGIEAVRRDSPGPFLNVQMNYWSRTNTKNAFNWTYWFVEFDNGLANPTDSSSGTRNAICVR